MKKTLFKEILNGLEYGTLDIQEFNNKCKNEDIEYWQAEQFIYSKKENERFEWFIALYDAILKVDQNNIFKIFRESYCSSNNIYKQIQNSQFSFDIKDYFQKCEQQNLDFSSLMNDSEREYYDELPKCFKIYRGINRAEHLSKNYGISWTLSENEAKKYAYFSENNIDIGEGGLLNRKVDKSDIITVFTVHDKNEIVYLI